jgi:2-keto-4-pentenoate hydratase/2-oxohepta-3-ene-1,7-dioic acid hydratase in catechol pathway
MKIICIGRNYGAHAKELQNAVPEEPIVFMKPPTALLVNNKPLYYPSFTDDLHYEVEVIIKIGKNGKQIEPQFAKEYIAEIGLGIDFTARDIQAKQKAKGLPWEIAKAFDHSAVLGDFKTLDAFPDPQCFEFKLFKNDEVVQIGNTADCIFSFETLIVYVSKYFKLQMGDFIFTGTPAGVGPVVIGDQLEGKMLTKEGWESFFHCHIK